LKYYCNFQTEIFNFSNHEILWIGWWNR